MTHLIYKHQGVVGDINCLVTETDG